MAQITSGSLTIVDVTDGAPGLNNTTVFLYRRAVSAPDKPTGNLTYTFSTASITGALEGWVQSIDELTGSDPIWMIAAVASSNGETDVIESSEWAGPIKMAQNGQDGLPGTPGTNGLNQATIFIYKRADSATAPSSTTYTFATGGFTVPSGWSKTIPTEPKGKPCWVTSAIAIGAEATAELNWVAPSVLVEDGSDGKDGTSPTVIATENGVKIVDADGNETFITNGADGTSYYTFVRYSKNANGSGYVAAPTSETIYIGVYTGTKSSPPAYSDSGWTWSRYVGVDGQPGAPGSQGPQGVSVTATRELYYLKTNSTDPAQITNANQIHTTDDVNQWTSVVPTYIGSGKYYTCIETNLSNGNTVWSAPIENKGLTDANVNAANAIEIARGVKQHFFWVATDKSANIPAGAYVAEESEESFYSNPTKGNILTRSDGIWIRNGVDKLVTLQGSGLTFLVPTGTYKGQKSVSLNGSGLTFYNIGSSNSAAATLASDGLQITNGSIVLGTTGGTAAGNVTLSNKNFTRSINGTPHNDLRFAIGSKFGVASDGTLYATGGVFDNYYTTEETDKAIDDIEVGGRNYLFGTETMAGWGTNNGTTIIDGVVTFPIVSNDTWREIWPAKNFKYELIRNRTVVFSAEVKALSGQSSSLNLCIGLDTTETAYQRRKYKNQRVNFTGTGDWQKVSITSNITDAWFESSSGTVDYNNCWVTVRPGAWNNSHQGYQLKHLKIEIGNKATDWTPAPEDVQAEIDEKKSIHTLMSASTAGNTYATILGWCAEGHSDTWQVTSVDGVKKGDTVRIGYPVSDMNKAIVYGVGTVTDINGNVITMTSHGLDTTIIDGGNILTNSIGANQIAANAITIGKLDESTQEQITNRIKASDSKSGSIVTWENMLIDDLDVDIEPIQDLHGYDKPWVGGAGKNKLPYPYTNNSGKTNGITYSTTADGRVTISGTATATAWVRLYGGFATDESLKKPVPSWITADTDYVLSGGQSSNFYVQANIYSGTSSIGQWIDTGSGKSFSLTSEQISNADSFAVFIRVNSGQTVNATITPMIEEGSARTSWKPYENICPISGRTEVVTQRVGKNFIPYPYRDMSKTVNGITSVVSDDGSVVLNGTATENMFLNFCLENNKVQFEKGSYVLSSGTTLPIGVKIYANVRVGSRNLYGVSIDSNHEATMNAQQSGFLRCYIAITSGTTVNNLTIKPMLRLASDVDNTYELYNCDTYTTELGTTVYGGTLDVTTGVLTVDRAIITYNGTESWLGSNSGMRVERPLTGVKVPPNNSTTVGLVCNEFSETTSLGTWDGTIGVAIDTRGYFSVCKTGQKDMTPSAFQAFLHTNPMQVVYPLATPTTVQLTAQQISALVGTNALWANSGDVHIELMGVKDYIDSISDAAKTATTYITDIDSNLGITVKPATKTGNDYLQMNSTDIRFVRNNVDVMNLTDSVFRIGTASGKHSTVDTNGLHVWIGAESTAANEVALFGTTARIGKTDKQRIEVTSSVVSLYDSNNKERTQVNTSGLLIKNASGNTKASIYDTITLYGGDGTYPLTQITSSNVQIAQSANNYANVNSSGLQVYQSGDEIASFGSTTRIGKTASKHLSLDATNGLQIFTGTESASTNIAQFSDTGIIYYSTTTVNSDGSPSGVDPKYRRSTLFNAGEVAFRIKQETDFYGKPVSDSPKTIGKISSEQGSLIISSDANSTFTGIAAVVLTADKRTINGVHYEGPHIVVGVDSSNTGYITLDAPVIEASKHKIQFDTYLYMGYGTSYETSKHGKVAIGHSDGGEDIDSGLFFRQSGNNNVTGIYVVNTSFAVGTNGYKSKLFESDKETRAMYCYEMPSPMFGDIGCGETDNMGLCYVDIDKIFANASNVNIVYQVFLQKEGEGDLWVEEKNSTYFIVKGTANLKFSWELKAKQTNFETERMEVAQYDRSSTDFLNDEPNYLDNNIFMDFINDQF